MDKTSGQPKVKQSPIAHFFFKSSTVCLQYRRQIFRELYFCNFLFLPLHGYLKT
jgi:hypothetical protein